MAQLPEGPVVLGVDGSEAGRPAVEWAARFAATRHRPLRVVYVHPVQALATSVAPGVLPVAPEEWRPAFERLVADVVERARQAGGDDLEVTGYVAEGYPAGVLIDEAAAAGLLVVGSRGLGGFAGLVVGSVGIQVAAHATSPVVIVPGDATPTATNGPVVVGVDGSELSLAAVGFAFEEASFRGTDLVAVGAWTVPTGLDLAPVQTDVAEFGADADRALAESLAGFQERYPDVTVHRQVTLGSPAQVLLDAAKGAQLLVVGSRGRGGFTGMLLGSVSQTLLHHAEIPVAILKTR
jgi:nucleotide-binding universal stress UspA family protein